MKAACSNIAGVTVGGNVQVANNSLTGSFLNKITVAETVVTGNLQLSNNSATGGSFLNVVDVVFNFVGGSAELLQNTAGLFISVLANEVTNNLECAANKPPPGRVL